MIEYKFKIENLDGFLEGLKKAPEITVDELNKAVTTSIRLFQEKVIKEAPVNKQSGGGNLRQSVHQRMINKISGEVTVDAKYAGYVEEGTVPHYIEGNNYLYWKGAPHPVTHVFHPGTAPNPFFKRSFDYLQPIVQNLFNKGLENIFNRIASMAK